MNGKQAGKRASKKSGTKLKIKFKNGGNYGDIGAVPHMPHKSGEGEKEIIMTDIVELSGLFFAEMTNVSNKVINGEMTVEEAELKDKFFKKANIVWKKSYDLQIKSDEGGSQEIESELKKVHMELEQLLKKEGLV